MHRKKHIIQSAVLGRMAHADIFQLSERARFLFAVFGGSGGDEDEYVQRSETVIPIFDDVLSACGDQQFVFAYISAPYDVPFRRFSQDPGLAVSWNRHILEELLKVWNALPFFVCGFSGGAALALSGIHRDRRCFGGATIGCDALPAAFDRPEHWREPLQMFCAKNDLVCNHPDNRQITATLAEQSIVEEFILPSGRHRLLDYANANCLGLLTKLAGQLVTDT